VEIRYHLDEHVDRAVAEGLRHRGVDVTTTVGAGLEGAADEDQLTFAAAQGRVFVTRDRHFLVLHSHGVAHAGIAFWHSKRRNVGQLVLDLVLLWRATTAEEMRGRVEYLQSSYRFVQPFADLACLSAAYAHPTTAPEPDQQDRRRRGD